MLFIDVTKSLIEQSIEAAREAVDDERINTANMYEDYLAADQLQHMTKLTGAKGAKYADMPKLTHPFAERIISEYSMTYKRPPARYFDSAKPTRANKGIWQKSKHDEEAAIWHDRAENDEADYNPTFIGCDKKTRMHGRTIMRVWPAFNLGTPGAKENYPRFDVFHPGQFDVAVDARYPSRPLAVILYLQTADAAIGDNVAQVWTPEVVVEVVNGKKQTPVPNKLGALPFIGFANYIDPQEYWRAGMGRKICVQNAIFDLGWTHAFTMTINQAHGQPVGTNMDKRWQKNPEWDWDKVIDLPDKDSKFEFARSGADINGMIAILGKIVENTYFACGLPTARFRDGYVPASGMAYRLENSTILEDREERAGIFAPRDRAAWRMAFRVAKAFGMTQLEPPKSMIVDYAEPEIPVDTTEALARRDSDLKAGLISMVDEYRAKNPDIMGDEEALEELRRNAEINAEFLGVKAAPTLRELVAKSKAAKVQPTKDEPVDGKELIE